LVEDPDLHQESPRCDELVRYITPQLVHPFTHHRCPLRHEFTGPPRRADSSPSRHALPPLLTVLSYQARSEKMFLANLCNRPCCQYGHPSSRPTHELRAHTRIFLRLVRAPRDPHASTGRETRHGHVGASSQPAFTDSYPGLESRSGWCRRRELWPDPDVPTQHLVR